MSRTAHRSVNRHALIVARAAGRGAFKGAALVGAFIIIVATWWWDASLLTAAADENLRLIKAATHTLPFGWGSKVESALRIFGADRALLLTEGIVVAKLIMLAVAFPFRRRRL
ncbi:MAG TPA: hypothetical protein VJ770_30195 [Stellaceae bacterium]|nr:hypothetical protein [Stellaceae bacterium]